MTRALLILLGILLFTPANASASVTGDIPFYKLLAEHFYVPLPDAYVHRSDCPAYDFGGPCASSETHDVWLPEWSLSRFALAHELGHQYDEQFLNDSRRKWLRQAMGGSRGGVWLRQWGPNERFADFYGLCALGYDMRPRRSSPEGYISHPSRKRLLRVCAAIRGWG